MLEVVPVVGVLSCVLGCTAAIVGNSCRGDEEWHGVQKGTKGKGAGG